VGRVHPGHRRADIADVALAVNSTFTVDGRRVGWHQYGDPAGRPVLFLHGWGMMLSGYRRALDALAGSGWAVHACDLPGFGGSEPLPLRRSSLAGYAQVIADAHRVGPLQGEPVPVAGHSFGAGIAARAAATDLTTFAALLLICPVGGAGTSLRSWVVLARGLLLEVNQELAIRASDSVTAVLRNPLPLSLSAYAAKTADLTGELTTLHRRAVPAHLVLADHDSIVPAGRLRTAPSASTRVVSGNHGWMLRNPQQFAATAHQLLAAA
jgi:pimeloyl-ACP methyl ester carboxylesterase